MCVDKELWRPTFFSSKHQHTSSHSATHACYICGDVGLGWCSWKHLSNSTSVTEVLFLSAATNCLFPSEIRFLLPSSRLLATMPNLVPFISFVINFNAQIILPHSAPGTAYGGKMILSRLVTPIRSVSSLVADQLKTNSKLQRHHVWATFWNSLDVSQKHHFCMVITPYQCKMNTQTQLPSKVWQICTSQSPAYDGCGDVMLFGFSVCVSSKASTWSHQQIHRKPLT